MLQRSKAEPYLNDLFSCGSGRIGYPPISQEAGKKRMAMDTPKLVVVALMAAGLGAGTPTLAQPTTAPATVSQPTAPTLAIPELTERLSRNGYREVREIERKSDKLYKVTARDAQGRTHEMDVDARTGEILASEEDDDGR
jgi:hypothetical protein